MENDYNLEREERARAAARAVASTVNEIGFDVMSFADELCKQHRTLQQTTFRAFGAFLLKLAEDDFGHDLRNEHATNTAKEIVKLFGDRLRFVPHV